MKHALIKALATEIDGLDARHFPPRDVVESAQANNIVIVYGASDDLMEFTGAISDEVGVYEGGTALLRDGVIFDPYSHCDCYDGSNPCKFLKAYIAECKTITAHWCKGEATWSYETDIPHETFRIMEDDDLYCIGLVFDRAEVT